MNRLPAAAPVSLAEAIGRVQPAFPDVASVSVGKAFPDAPFSAGGDAAASRAATIDVAVRVPRVGDLAESRAGWEAEMVVGAVADLVGIGPMTRDGAVGRTILVLPDGARTEGTITGGGFMASRQAFVDETADDTKARVGAIAARYGYEVLSVRTTRGLSSAPMMVLRVSGIASLANQPAMTAELVGPGDAPRYEGYYLEIVDPVGKPLLVRASSERTGTGRGWSDPQVPLAFRGFVSGSGQPSSGASSVVASIGGIAVRGLGTQGDTLSIRIHLSGAGNARLIAFTGKRLLASGVVRFDGPAWRIANIGMHGLRKVSVTSKRPLRLLVEGVDAKGRRVTTEFTFGAIRRVGGG